MDLITAYLIGIVVLIGLFALRTPHEDLRTVFALGIAWPLSVIGIVLMILLYSLRWDLDVAKGTKTFGFRRPTNPQARGWALTLFGTEIQVYTVKRKTAAEVDAEIDRLHK